MTTSEPPEHRPTPPAGSEHPASETPASEHPASEHPLSDHPAPEHAVASESPTEQIEPSGTEHSAEHPAEHGAAAPAAAGAGVGAFAAQPRSTRPGGGSRWNPGGWSPRRRWIGIAVLVVLVLLIVGLILGLSGHHRHGHRHGHHGGHGHFAFQQGMPGHGRGMGGMGMAGGFGGQGGGFGGPQGGDQMGGDQMGGGQMGQMGGDRMGGPGGPQGQAGGVAQAAPVTGSVVSVAPGTLVVAQDGAGQVTVPTTDNTRMMGAGNGLTGLQPGQRVVVRVGPDKSAVAVFVPKAQAVGTITAIAGDRATLVRPDGLTEPVDLAAVNPKPVNGDVVAVSGTAADNGATLHVETLRAMPKAG